MNKYLSRTAYLEEKRDKRQSRADAFKWDARMEELAALHDSHPDVLEHSARPFG
ncbi:hypothetical protein [Streptomyces sp. NPDC001274]